MTPEVRAALSALAAGRAFTGPPASVTRCRIRGKDVAFCTDMENDPIQRKNRVGAFYETSDLYQLDGHFPTGGTFLDIGANVGNHSLYFALMLGAGHVVPIEPNPACWRLLVQNVLANRLSDRFDLSFLGVGLSDQSGAGYGMQARARNIGAAAMVPEAGEIAVHRGDSLLAGLRPDLIKVDVEGMELAVLRGLSGLLDDIRPKLFVEVSDTSEASFRDWCDRAGYTVIFARQRYRKATNYLLGPSG